MLPGNREKQSINDGRQRLKDRCSLLEQNLHTSGKFYVQYRITFQLQCSSIFTGWKYLCRIFSLSSRNLFCESLLSRNYTFCGRSKIIFSWEINSSNTAALHAHCPFHRVRNRFQPQTSLWNYEKTMLIKIVAIFRNLLISSFDATIRVKRAFHPALAL